MARKRERRNGARPRADKAEIHEPCSVYPIAGGAAHLSDTCRVLAKTAAAAGIGVARLLLRQRLPPFESKEDPCIPCRDSMAKIRQLLPSRMRLQIAVAAVFD